jgi:hypothetical protein
VVQRSVILTLSLSLVIPPATTLADRAAARAAAPVDGGWPRVYVTGSGASLVLYEPQIASWADQKRMVMYAAASYAARDQQTPGLGTLRIEADTKISAEERLVDFSALTITAATFQTLSPDQVAALVRDVDASVPREERVIGLERVLAAVDPGQVRPRNVDGVKADPPVVFYSTKPAVLVNIDGDPIWNAIKDTGLRFAINANRDLFEDIPSSSYYLRTDTSWMRATSLEGPWRPVGRLPDSFSRLPDDGNWQEARRALDVRSAGGQAPAVFVSRRPAELVLLRGAPTYASVPGTGLLWVINTDSDIFRAGKTGRVYYLVAGRWFSAPDFTGPWTFATPTLPDDFMKIPLEHARSRVLASVPGTTQAIEAVLLAQVPQTARVSRTQVSAPEVAYQGEPQFEPIEATTVARAVNTDRDILRIGPVWQPLYYMCVDGVWFLSLSPTGPWALADSIPVGIYEIPISSPAYNVTSVTVESADGDAVVFATEPAYSGKVVAWDCAVWGTGWSYAPYVGWRGNQPVYYPRSGGPVDSSPHGRPNGVASWRTAGNIYGNWRSTAVVRGDLWAKTSRFTNRATSATARATQGSGGEAISRRGPVGGIPNGRTDSGNVFAGHDGNVYRNEGGSWQRLDAEAQQGASRKEVAPATLKQLNHDLAARREGNRRMTSRL